MDFRQKRVYNGHIYQKGAEKMMHFAEYDSPVGTLLLQSDGEHLTGLWMDRECPETTRDPVLERAMAWLDDYFRGEVREVDVPLAPTGTAFQQQVWQILLTIPYGQARTYGDIAREMAARLGKEKMTPQAVGQAVGSNPISILIPCHRVVGAKGQLTGYAWGIEKKKWLLNHEAEM